jgi:hypothetical protein
MSDRTIDQLEIELDSELAAVLRYMAGKYSMSLDSMLEYLLLGNGSIEANWAELSKIDGSVSWPIVI